MIDFHALRLDPKHHLGLGDIRITIDQQEEILAEIERLRGLVEAAFHEGWSRSDGRDVYLPDDWEHSDARKSITPPTPTPAP